MNHKLRLGKAENEGGGLRKNTPIFPHVYN